MVVTRKTPVAPMPVASRTNSAHALPRAAKPKTNSTLATETEKEAAAKNVPAMAASPKPHPKSKHKNRHQKKPIKSSNGWLDRLVYLSLSLFALYAFTTCPHDSTLSNPVCRSLSQYRTHVLEPYVLPPIYRALEHPTVAPYVEKAQHIERTALRPTYEKYLRPAYKRAAPYAAAAKRALWDRAAVPAFHAYVAPQYRKHVLPQWHKHAAPHIARAAPYAARAQHGLERTAHALRTTYATRVAPAVSRAYAVGKPWAIRGYRTARPHAVALYVLVADKAGAARRAYVDPHVRRIWEKVLELSGAGPVGSPTGQPTPVPEKEPEPTAASAEDATTEQVASETSVEATVTAAAVETSSSAAAPSAEEEVPEPTEASASSVLEASSASSVVPPVEAPVTVAAVETSSSADASASSVLEASSASSVVPPVEASTVGPAEPSSSIIEAASTPESTPATVEPEMNAEMKAEILEELSAASIALQSAHGMESPVVEEILADAKASVTATPPGSAVPEPSAGERPEEDDAALLDFLGGIGLDEDFFVEEEAPFVSDIAPDDDADLELTQEEIDALKAQEAAEQAAAKTRTTAEKRADLEGRMAQSIERLPVVAAEKTRLLRETLAGLRKSAAGTLDDEKTEVGGAVPSLRKEGDKLLAGLEGYLKKEAAKTKKGDPARWEMIVGKVEEKLGESIHSAQGVLQAFHVEEKAKEVDEGMYIIQEMKDACSQAQGNVGLELAWLDDVTYHDWQVYHSLAKFGEDFQATASAIQAGTHEDSPADPFIARLEEEQKALGDLVNELIGRINTLKQQAAKTFAPEPVPEAPPVQATPPAEDAGENPEGGNEESGSEAKEPEVSILPVPPVAEPGVVDPAQVIIGKSAEQVKQAVRIAEEHKEL